MKRKALIFILVALILFTSSEIFTEDSQEIMEIKEKLVNISEEEKEILKKLFVQVQEIEEMERESKRIDSEIGDISRGIESLDLRIREQEKEYEKNLDALEAVLKTYQRMGPGSYLEIILSSDSLTSLIRRINILKDLTKNTEGLLGNIEEKKRELSEEKLKLDESKRLLGDKQAELEENIARKQVIVKNQEDYLASLLSHRELYLERLEYISIMMAELKKLIGEFTQGFTKIIEEGNFPSSGIKQNLTLRGIKATIEEEVFNDIINSYEWIPKMEIRFRDGQIELNAPDKGLFLTGNFSIEEGQLLKFLAESGSFLDMPLEAGTLSELFEAGDFLLDFEPIIGSNIIKTVEAREGYLEILVAIKLF
ncbi:MAG: hypothetical protein WCZ27_00035 [Tissierellaceae bacterium]